MKKLKKLKFNVTRGINIKYRTYRVSFTNELDLTTRANGKEYSINGTKITVCTEKISENKILVGVMFLSPRDYHEGNYLEDFAKFVAYHRIQKGKCVEIDISKKESDETIHDYIKSAVLELSKDTRWMQPVMTADLV